MPVVGGEGVVVERERSRLSLSMEPDLGLRLRTLRS